MTGKTFTCEPELIETFPNGSVSVALDLTYTAGSIDIAAEVADKIQAILREMVGSAHVPAVRSPEEREMTLQGVGDFDPELEEHNRVTRAARDLGVTA